MNARSHARFALPKITAALALLFFPGMLRGDAPQPLFEEDVVPILETRCFKCHGAEKQEGGLDLRRKFKIVQGGDGGAALISGKPDESLLIEKVVSKEMPPKGDDPLDDKQIEVLRRWIATGAATKVDPEPPLEATDSESTLSEADRNWWAFQSAKRVDPPVVRESARVRTPIDAFLLAKLEEKNISFNPDASKQVVLRRLAFDLTGLPPTPEMLAEFEADTTDGGYERVVDKLLNSDRFGEHWARHWLDVAGYADSDGYLDADRERPEAWRYRDYVIRAFNTDKPYDRFTLEQVAGDELSDWRRAEELSPGMVDELTATGFLRTAVDPTYGGWKEKVEINKVIADTIQIVGSTYFGLTIQCARCHQHKHDPLSQRDYYSLAAVLGAAYDPEPARWLVSLERAVPLATESQQTKINEWNTGVDQRIAKLNGELIEIKIGRRAKLIAERLDAAGATMGLSKEDREALVVAAATPDKQRNDDQKRRVTEAKLEEKGLAAITVSDEEVNARWPDTPNEVAKLTAAVTAETALKKPLVMLRGIQDLADTAHPTHVLRRGDFNSPGRVVEPNVPVVLSTGTSTYAPQPGYKTTGRRVAFANWLVDPRHPTTARVHVNRLWGIVFGRGLVETVDDFGRLGAQPTHPELLDWLATEFVNGGWSQKKLLKLMVMSTAYRQSSALDPAKTAIDDTNAMLGTFRPKRLTGEQLRDGLLAVSGKLDLTLYGPPTKVHLQGDGSVITADDAAGNRRSVYLQVRRSEPVTIMDTFDTPRMEINCTRRTEATVPTQALTMLNSPFMQVTSQAFSQRILAQPDRAARIEWAVRVAFGRAATDADRAALNAFLDDYAKNELGEKFTAADAAILAAAEQKAWLHAAAALLNANEFLYVE
jgi:hypothetical protein